MCIHQVLADAKWTEHPDAGDARGVERVAAELPAGSVKRCGIVCRAPNPYPLSRSTHALPLGDLPEEWL